MSTTPNPSLQKKTASRMAAVQSLYRQAITKETSSPAEEVAALKKQLANNRDEQKLLVGLPIEPNYALLEKLLEGVGSFGAEINMRLDGALSHEWKRERMSPLLLAILQCAIFELFLFKDTKPNIVIDEYTRLARGFFADTEVNFVHGALQGLVQAYG